MKLILITFALICSSILKAQEGAPGSNTDNVDLIDERDSYVEELAPEEGGVEGTEGPVTTSKVDTDKIRVECVCPDNQAEREMAQEEVAPEYIPSIFPPGTDVTIMPTPDPNTPTKVEVQERQYPPGYIERLPMGYSSDGYKPIGTFEDIKR